MWRLPPARWEGQPGLSRAVLQAVGRPGRPCAPSCLRSAMPSAPRCDLCISFCQDKPAGPRPTSDSDRGTHSRRPRGKAGACSEPFLIPSPLCHCGQERSRCGQRRDHPELGDQGLNTENPTCVRSPVRDPASPPGRAEPASLRQVEVSAPPRSPKAGRFQKLSTIRVSPATARVSRRQPGTGAWCSAALAWMGEPRRRSGVQGSRRRLAVPSCPVPLEAGSSRGPPLRGWGVGVGAGAGRSRMPHSPRRKLRTYDSGTAASPPQADETSLNQNTVDLFFTALGTQWPCFVSGRGASQASSP